MSNEEKKKDYSHNLVLFLDLETTGLSPVTDVILEVATILCEMDEGAELRPIFQLEWVVYHDWINKEQLHPKVLEMHTKNGLLDAVRGGSSLSRTVEPNLVFMLQKAITDRKLPEDTKIILAGSSIWFDRAFIKRNLPEVEKLLHYRMIDVTSIGMFLWQCGWEEEIKDDGIHRANHDVMKSFNEFRKYRDILSGVF